MSYVLPVIALVLGWIVIGVGLAQLVLQVHDR
ncbi:hypothetical protein SEA_ESTES_91 [Mycobacterium phage Estes]|uniref:Uncharacterized protein n=1 Tax=Mycobacterium phage Estes TaxID=2759459 RepID=A0A7G9A2G1_9CAUD|nr:hypothetical protein J4U03_gp091 [Mycobacterium phage Estes]QNL30800.1 hypothetical protein SEA_ESTES_91 [Mycobacterium phage Estes]